MSAELSNVVPFGPEGQVLEGIALLVAEAVRVLRSPAPQPPLTARQARAKLSAAMGLMNVLMTYQAAKEGRNMQVVMVSTSAASAVLEVARTFANRALEGLITDNPVLTLDNLKRVQLELTQSQVVIGMILGDEPSRAALG